MARDPMQVLQRLCRAAEDEARRAFAARLAEEAAAQLLVDEAEARMMGERAIATDPALGDGAVEAFIAWLPAGRRQIQAAQAAHERASANVTIARAALTVTHAAAEAVTTILEQRAEEAAGVTARKSQGVLDEIAARPKTAPG